MSELLKITLGLFFVGASAWGAQAGVVTTKMGPLRDNAYSVVSQADGKILVAGASHNGKDSDFAILRYLPDGTLDKTFGDSGIAIFDSKLGDDQAYGVAVQTDGKIVAVGSAFNGQDTDMVIMRFLPSGVLDQHFGKNGVVKQDFNIGKDVAYSVAIQPDGMILMAGAAFNGTDLDFSMVRVDRTGKMDTTFGSRGRLTTGFGDANDRTGDEHGYSIALQPDGKILLSGYSEVADSSVFATMRYTSNGQLDKTWGQGGLVSLRLGSHYDRAYTSVLQPDGKLVVGGSSSTGIVTQFAMVRFLSNGRLDREFGTYGKVFTQIGKSVDVIYSLALQDNGRIVAAGSSVSGTQAHFALARYMPDGSLDMGFGTNGVSLAQFNTRYNAVYGVAIQNDRKILLAGVTSGDDDYQVAVARYNADGIMDATFGSGDTVVAHTRRRTSITAEVGLPGWVFPLFPGAP